MNGFSDMDGRWGFGKAMLCVRTATAVLVATAILSGRVAGRDRPKDDDPRRTAEQLLAPLPADVDAVVVVNGAAAQRDSAPGRSLASLVMELGPLSETARVWNEQLASPLGWTPGQAFDELLGRRVLFVARGLGDAEKTEWAILSEVTPEAEARLRACLKPAPRRVDGEAVVLALENGKYELGVSRREAAAVVVADGSHAAVTRTAGRGATGKAAGGAARSLILLARAKDARLFDELVPRLREDIGGCGGEEPDAFVAVRGAGAARLLGEPAEGDAGRAIFVLKATRSDGGWRAECVSSPGLPFGPVGDGAEVRPWSDASFRGLKRGSMLAVMGYVGAVKQPRLPHMLDLPILSALGVARDLPVGPRGAMAVSEPGAAGTVSVSVAVETADVEKLSVRGDPLVAGLVPVLTGGEAGDSQRLVAQFNGAPPQGIRIVRLGGEFAELGAPMFGREPALVWTYPASEVAKPAAPAAVAEVRSEIPVGAGDVRWTGEAPVAANAGAPGWWVLSIAPGDASLPSGVYDALRAPEAGERTRRLSAGMVKAARLASWIGTIDAGTGTLLAPLRWVESVEWDSALRDDGLVECRVDLRMASPAAR